MRRGFTLLEILVVVCIIAILATLSIISITGWREKTTKAKVLNDMRESMKIVNACKTLGGTLNQFLCGGQDCWYKSGEPICTDIPNEASANGASLMSGNWPAMPSDAYKYIVGGVVSDSVWYVKHNPGTQDSDILTCTESGCQPGDDW